MKNKLFAIGLCSLLLLSSLMLMAQRTERLDEINYANEEDIGENASVKENLEKTNREKLSEYSLDDQEIMHDGEIWDRDLPESNHESRLDEESPDLFGKGNLEGEEERNPLQVNQMLENYTNHDPIRIDNNTELKEKANAGNGTEEYPYEIEGYEIDGGGYGYAIYIGNVSEHFTVRNCILYNSSGNNNEFFENTGLYLFNTTNARVENNTLIDNQNGLTTRSSENTVISDNEVYIDEEESDMESFSSRDDERFYGSAPEERDYSPDSVLLKLDIDSDFETKSIDRSESILESKANELSEMIGGEISRVFPSIEGAELRIEDEDSVSNVVDFLSRRSSVKYAEPNYQYDLMTEPNDPGYDSLWGMEKIDAPGAWNVTTGSEDVVVAVMDTGIDYNHPDLEDNMWTSEEGYHGYNAVNDSYYPMDNNGHGTHVAGTIGAVGNNSEGVVGVNWNVSLMGVRIGDASGITTADVLAGMEYVLEKRRDGENIVATSNSWGGGEKSQLMKEAIAEHRDEDILFVAGAGNDARDNDRTPFYPASYDLTNIISVAATDQDDELAGFSNYGERSVHVAAPGVDINSTVLDGEYDYMSGTSMATPHVSGLAALLAAEETDYNYNQLKNALLSSTDEVKELEGKIQTDGRINASQTLDPDPVDVQFRVHRPLKQLQKGRNTSIMVSLDDGVDPITEANVTAEISTRRDDVELRDDGSGQDQVAEDGYYTSGWTPRVSGEIMINITAEWNGEEISEEIVVNVFGDSGIALFDSVEENLVNNTVSNYDFGLSLSSSPDNTIEDNNISRNEIGYDLYRSDTNTIANNTAWGNGLAVLFEEADENVLIDNNISMNEGGVGLLRSENNTVIQNEIYGNLEGVMIQGLGGNIIEENNLTYNEMGIGIMESRNNTLTNNDISGDGESLGIFLMGTSENEIVNNSVTNHQFGISSFLSDDDLIENNEITDNQIGLNFGFFLFFVLPSNDNEVINNQIINNEFGIYSFASNNNMISDNEIKDNIEFGVMLFGMELFVSTDNQISDNVIESNGAGDIMLMESTGNYIENNTMTRGLVVIGEELEHWNTHEIDTSNTVDGSPVYYLKNEEDETVPSEAGQVILANSKNVTIEDLNINNVTGGFLIGFSDDISIINNDLSQNMIGIHLWESHNNELTENTISNNEFGIELGFSDNTMISDNEIKDNTQIGLGLFESVDNELRNNIIETNELGIIGEWVDNTMISDNEIKDNTQIGLGLLGSAENELRNNTIETNEFGIVLMESHNNELTENTVSNNEFGIELGFSEDNIIYRNRFINNENQAFDNWNNEWDNGDPAEDGDGGNYWSDYDGGDRGDGIGKEPYKIEGDNNQDSYPWMSEDMILEEENDTNIIERIIDGIINIIEGIIDGIINIIEGIIDGIISIIERVTGQINKIYLGSAQDYSYYLY